MDQYWDEDDDWIAEVVDDHLRQLQVAPAFDYLARNGDSIEERVRACIAEAQRLSAASFHGPAVAAAGTAIELTIRYFLVRPLLQGAFLSDEWAKLLGNRILQAGSRGVTTDRELLPAILRNWGIDLGKIRTRAGSPVWEELQRSGGLVDLRNRHMHRGERVPAASVPIAIECAERLLDDVVAPLADHLGFSRGETGTWSVVKKRPPASLKGADERRMFEELNPPTTYDRMSPF